jgi:trimeric autotransporter adhesin
MGTRPYWFLAAFVWVSAYLLTAITAHAQFVCSGSAAGGSATGTNSFSCGTGASAIGDNTSAAGINAIASGNQTTSFGTAAGALTLTATGTTGNTNVGFASGTQAVGANNTSLGRQTGQLVTGDGNAALGQSSGSGVDGDQNVGIGFQAGRLLSGNNNIAIGFNAGSGASPGSPLVASNTISIGNGASAGSHQNAAAFGAGALAVRDNQQAFGTTTNTYTMAGLNSTASKTAQGTPTHLVTANTGGDLASYTFSELGIATIADLSGFATKGDLAGIQSEINRLGRRDHELAEGIASVAALAQPILLPGQHFAMRAGWGGYDDASAVGFSAAGVVANNLLGQGRGTLTLDGGVGFGTSEGEVAGRAGATIGW